MPTVQERLEAYAPELASESQTRIDIFLEDAVSLLAPGCFVNVDLWSQGVALLAAHMLTMSNRGSSGGVGPVTLERAGEVAIQYASIMTTNGSRELGTTPYGQRLAALLRSQPCTHMFTTGFTESDL